MGVRTKEVGKDQGMVDSVGWRGFSRLLNAEVGRVRFLFEA